MTKEISEKTHEIIGIDKRISGIDRRITATLKLASTLRLPAHTSRSSVSDRATSTDASGTPTSVHSNTLSEKRIARYLSVAFIPTMTGAYDPNLRPSIVKTLDHIQGLYYSSKWERRGETIGVKLEFEVTRDSSEAFWRALNSLGAEADPLSLWKGDRQLGHRLIKRLPQKPTHYIAEREVVPQSTSGIGSAVL